MKKALLFLVFALLALNVTASPSHYSKADAAMASVKVKAVYDPDKFTLQFLCVMSDLNPDGSWYFSEELDSGSIEVPNCLCDMALVFDEILPDGSFLSKVFLVKEEVDPVLQKEIVFDVDEATNILTFQTQLPSGEEIVLPTMEIVNEAHEGRVVREGNIDSTFKLYQVSDLIDSRYGKTIYTSQLHGFANVEKSVEYNYPGSRPLENIRVRINDASDMIRLSTQRYFIAGDELCMVDYNWHSGKPAAMSNIPGDYHKYPFAFAETPLASRSPLAPGEGWLPYTTEFHNVRAGDGIEMSSLLPQQHNLNICLDRDTEAADFHCRMRREEYGVYDDKYGEVTAYGIKAPSIYLSPEDCYLQGSFGGDYSILPDDEKTVDPLESPWLLPYRSLGVAFGGSCPFANVLVFTVEADEDMGAMRMYGVRSIGWAGEWRKIDELATTTRAWLDGSQLDLSAQPLNQAMTAHIGNGDWRIETVNTNIEIDGLPGHNTAILELADHSATIQVPVIQMMRMTGPDGVVRNVFDKPGDAFIAVAGGVFEQHYDPETFMYWFACDEAVPVLTVEYSPYGSGEWRGLEAVCVPENFYMPGLGHYFGASLEGLTATSPSGWFDMRLSLSDGRGNVNTQVLSPAFKVNSQAGMTMPVAGEAAGRIYDLQGRPVTGSPQHHGVYVEVTDGGARKIVL